MIRKGKRNFFVWCTFVNKTPFALCIYLLLYKKHFTNSFSSNTDPDGLDTFGREEILLVVYRNGPHELHDETVTTRMTQLNRDTLISRRVVTLIPGPVC